MEGEWNAGIRGTGAGCQVFWEGKGNLYSGRVRVQGTPSVGPRGRPP